MSGTLAPSTPTSAADRSDGNFGIMKSPDGQGKTLGCANYVLPHPVVNGLIYSFRLRRFAASARQVRIMRLASP
jgi:hypothetical protein